MKKKKQYVSPTTDVVEAKTEQILCLSNVGIISILGGNESAISNPFEGLEEVLW